MHSTKSKGSSDKLKMEQPAATTAAPVASPLPASGANLMACPVVKTKSKSPTTKSSTTGRSRVPAPLGLRKSDLAACNTSNITAAVMGATTLLNNSSKNIPGLNASMFSRSDSTEQRFLAASSSDNLIKETSLRRKSSEGRHKEKEKLLYREEIEDEYNF